LFVFLFRQKVIETNNSFVNCILLIIVMYSQIGTLVTVYYELAHWIIRKMLKRMRTWIHSMK